MMLKIRKMRNVELSKYFKLLAFINRPDLKRKGLGFLIHCIWNAFETFTQRYQVGSEKTDYKYKKKKWLVPDFSFHGK